ncbi:undecaprenyl-diphosphate phosphatase [Candidatus Kaiserbacteria bacterium]|nr:undecaprenyl-diphosphate phosphatase [Candidatus Kaiserbacteria bacterium]
MHIIYFILAVLEGFTEYLPISSTAHLILAGKILAIDLVDPYVKFYLLFIQLGALLAGAILFTKRILTDRSLLINLIVSFIPTAIIGFALYKVFKQLLEGNLPLIAAMLAIGGFVFIYLEKVFIPKMMAMGQGERTVLTIKDAAIVGIAQAIAIVPGVSRSGVTIVAGVLLGLKKTAIFEYTFFLALPTLGAAVAYDAFKSRDTLAAISSYSDLVLGFAVAAVVGFFTLLVVRKYLARLSLTGFGWYRIVLAAIIIAIIFT